MPTEPTGNDIAMLPSTDHEALAQELLLARAAGVTLPLITVRYPNASLADAYAVLDAIAARREALGEVRAGYKIGFTNRTLWQRYGVFAPIWAPVWRSTVSFVETGSASVSLEALCQPRLEPEIVFGFGATPRPAARLDELLACVEWVAHGFEIVHTHWDGWRFQAVDAVADFGLHGWLFVGARQPVASLGRAAEWSAALSALTVELRQGERSIDRGIGANVLDGPVQALEQWWQAMSRDTPGWTMAPGDLVTTGTLTDAAPLGPGQTWRSVLSDARWPGLALQTHR
jgi:2-oxo-3-hexenedioate decarboxylase